MVRAAGKLDLIRLLGAAFALEEDGETYSFHKVPDGEALLKRYSEFVAAVAGSEPVAGLCWTQLTDIKQEANDLLTMNREPKAVRQATLQWNNSSK